MGIFDLQSLKILEGDLPKKAQELVKNGCSKKPIFFKDVLRALENLDFPMPFQFIVINIFPEPYIPVLIVYVHIPYSGDA